MKTVLLLQITANDVHLNAVLPESEIPTTNKGIVENLSDPLSAASDDAPHLEFEDEVTTKIPATASPVTPNDPTYFSRVITSIFEVCTVQYDVHKTLVSLFNIFIFISDSYCGIECCQKSR